MCIFTVKSVVKYYTKQTSSVFTCFLDTAKAFDIVSHWTLFSKLIKRNIPLVIVRIIAFCYQTQPMCIKLDVSLDFSIRNDIKFNPIRSVFVVFKPKSNKLYCKNVRLDCDIL